MRGRIVLLAIVLPMVVYGAGRICRVNLDDLEDPIPAQLLRYARPAGDGPTLSGANLAGMRLRGVRLRGHDLTLADLSACDLRQADLRKISFTLGSLSNTDLRGARLNGARFLGVSFEGANLCGADLRGVRFKQGCGRPDTPILHLRGAIYDHTTRWDEGRDPKSLGAIFRRSTADPSSSAISAPLR
jgi:uncharacterized protein YjbI with pentapeptide repeats